MRLLPRTYPDNSRTFSARQWGDGCDPDVYHVEYLSQEDNTEGAQPGDVTVLLARIRAGERDAESRLFELVYQELYSIARRHARAERAGHTLGATAIVHEAYVRLFAGNVPDWKDRTHFYSTATRVMRNLLVDYARRRQTAKHNGGIQGELTDHLAGWDGRELDQVLLVDQALNRLAQRDPRQAKIFEMRFLAGLQVNELAKVFDLHRRTILRELRSAEAWLKAEVGEEAVAGVTPEAAGDPDEEEANDLP